MKSVVSYKSIVWTAVVTGVFSAIVGVGLVAGYFDRRAEFPLDEPEYLALKQQLELDAASIDSQAQLRELDVELRGRYFWQRTFAFRGAYLLGGGVIATLLLAHWAGTVQRRLPKPKPVVIQIDFETRQNQLGQWATGAIAVALVALVIGSTLASRSALPRTLAELDKSPQPDVSSLEKSPERPADVSAETTENQVASLPTPAQIAANWPRFRGPRGAGVSAFIEVPETWDGASGDGVQWQTAVELPGMSSPVVWEKRIFLTGANAERREVYCFAADSGELLWQRSVAENAEGKADIEVDETTGYAAPTPATDGQRVYAMFASGDLAAFDLDGNELWSRDFGILNNPYGHASSLATYQGLLIIQLDQGSGKDEQSKLLALRGATGETVWQAERAVPASWSTPIVVEYEGQPRIITCADPWVIAYAADDGHEIWRVKCLEGDVGPSPVYSSGVVYVANDNAVAAAIRDGGQGDVTESHLVWTAEFGMPDICSPLVTDRHLLLIASYGGLICYDREIGGEEPLWEEDLGATLLASPSLVGDRVYLIFEDGTGRVVKPGDTGVEQIAENNLGEPCFTSPAFQSGRIYLRGEEHLFCIGE